MNIFRPGYLQRIGTRIFTKVIFKDLNLGRNLSNGNQQCFTSTIFSNLVLLGFSAVKHKSAQWIRGSLSRLKDVASATGRSETSTEIPHMIHLARCEQTITWYPSYTSMKNQGGSAKTFCTCNSALLNFQGETWLSILSL
jgi:hypothetical protein